MLLTQRLPNAVKYINTHVATETMDRVNKTSIYETATKPKGTLHKLRWAVDRFDSTEAAMAEFEALRPKYAAAVILGNPAVYKVTRAEKRRSFPHC